MSVTDWKFAQTITEDVPSSEYFWVNLNNLKADDGNYSYCLVNQPGKHTRNIILSNFGFTSADIPSNSTIDGIEVEWAVYCGVLNNTNDYRFLLSLGEDKASTTYYTTSRVVRTYGGATDKWGASFTPSDICTSSFNLNYAGQTYNAGGGDTVYIDYFKIRVYYTSSGDIPTSKKIGIKLGNENMINVSILTDTGWTKGKIN